MCQFYTDTLVYKLTCSEKQLFHDVIIIIT